MRTLVVSRKRKTFGLRLKSSMRRERSATVVEPSILEGGEEGGDGMGGGALRWGMGEA